MYRMFLICLLVAEGALSAQETGSGAGESRAEAESSLQNWIFAAGAAVATAAGIVLVAINDGHDAH